MFRFVVLALTVSCAFAAGYGAVKGSNLGLARRVNLGLGIRTPVVAPVASVAPVALNLNQGFVAPVALNLNQGYVRQVPVGPITAAIQSTRTYEVIPVALPYEAAIPQTIEVPQNVQPVNIIFRTQSSPLNLQQIHTPGVPQFESSQSQDENSVLTHDNYRTVVQKYNEVIQPIRKINQRINPVIENVHTAVAQGEQRAIVEQTVVAQGEPKAIVEETVAVQSEQGDLVEQRKANYS